MTRIFWEMVSSMAADALLLCVTRSSAAITMTMWDQQVLSLSSKELHHLLKEITQNASRVDSLARLLIHSFIQSVSQSLIHSINMMSA